MKKRFLKYGILFAAILLGLLARVYVSAHRDWKSYEGAAQVDVQVHYLDRVIRWYFPGNPLNRRAVDRLMSLGLEKEKTNSQEALLAFDSLRGAIISIRHVVQPYEGELEKANAKILELRSAEHVRIDPKLSLKEARRFHRSALEKSFSSKSPWSFFVELGFFAWLLFVFLWIRKGFDSEGVMHWRTSLPWILGMLLSFGLWIMGLLNA